MAPLLVVEHERGCPPAWLGEWLTEEDVALEVRRPYRGEALPDSLGGHSGLLVLGGTMDALSDDRHPWLVQVKRLVREAARDGVPALGVCLGHQLAAVALGGTVEVNPAGQQIGVLRVGWAPEADGDALMGPLVSADAAVQWNNDIVTGLPAGATALAWAPTGELQAARFAPTVWGVQWHPEAGEAIVSEWADEGRDSAAERGVDVDAYVEEVADAEDHLRKCWRPLAASFARLVRDRTPS